ncbi:DUF3293 domain-containing protein [Azospirillum brasilense]|uniref:DUF3293 domain-containing protein n=1 Tax=Azospirillum brasilense TaxID=192 RepID=UPI003AF9B7CF|nr:DUF3293 domain-containing protein [Azospirillum brasilense]
MNHPIPSSLWDAHAGTVFAVFDGRQETAITIGTSCSRVDRLLMIRGVHRAAFVTAWAPRSRPCSRVANRRPHQRLRGIIGRRGRRRLPGEGRSPQAERASEPSLLILGTPLRDAAILGRSFGQNAVVFVERGRPARLVPSR